MCTAVDEIIEISPPGSCYPCCIVLEQDAYKMGNIFTDTFESIWLKMDDHSLFRRSKEFQGDSACQSCTMLEACMGGCPLSNLILYGNINSADRECPYRLE